MQENNRQRARRQIDATIRDVMKGIEQEALGKPDKPRRDEPSRAINIGTVNVYLWAPKGRFKRW